MIERVGIYAIERELGRGGMGVVYAGRAPTGDPVAIKVLLDPELDVGARLRFETEIAACARLLHPNVVRLLDAGREQGRPFLVLELLDGVALDERILREGPLPVPEAVALVAELANGLEAVHASGILHRDLKPSNVMLCPGRPVITDFGLARDPAQERERITVTGEMLGTPAYMAPEQAMAQKEALGPATDVYGLGAVLYHALTGHPPFRGTQLQILVQVLENPPERPSQLRPDVDADLDEVVLRCLAKRPEDRFPSAGALSEALDEYALTHRSGQGTHPPKLAVILSVALVLGAVGLWWSTRTTPSPAPTPTPTLSPTDSPKRTRIEEATRAFEARRRDEALAILNTIPTERWRSEAWLLCGRIEAVTFGVRTDPKARDRAIRAFWKALELDPDNLEAWQNLATFGTDLPELQEVEAEVQRRAGSTPIGRAIAGRATLSKVKGITDALEQCKRVELALSTFDQALHLDPACREAWLPRLGALDTLAIIAQRLRRLGPNAPPRASARAITTRITKAIVALQERFSGPDGDARLLNAGAAILRRQARRAQDSTLLPRAIQLATNAIQLEPRFGQAYFERALARWWLLPGTRAVRLEASREVLEDLQRACEWGPTAQAFEELSQAHASLSQLQAAEAAMTQAIARSPPGRPVAGLHLRRVSLRANLGQPALALQDLTAGWSAIPPSEVSARERLRKKLKLQAIAQDDARRHLALREWNEALACLQRTEDRTPEGWLLRGRILADRYRYLPNPADEAMAIQSFKFLLKKIASDHREAHVRLALLQPTHARIAVRMAKGGSPRLVALASVAAARGHTRAQLIDQKGFELAYAEVIRALKLDPGCLEAWTELLRLFAVFFSGKGLLSEELSRAWTWTQEHLATPKLAVSPRAQAMLGFALNRSARSGPRLQSAERALSQAIDLEPRLAFAWRVRGQIRIKQGIFPSGLDDLKEAARLSPWTPEILEDLGQGYIQSGDLERADAVLSKAIKASPQRSTAYGLRAVLRVKQGRHAEAAADMTKAKSLREGR